MKKLFTTLLLLGAVVGAQAQVTVTDYNAETKTVTLNYESGNIELPKQMDDWFRANYNWRPDQIKQNVSVIKFTGNWNNYHLRNGGEFSKLANHFENSGGVGFDLSSCEGFVSKFVSVEDDEKVNGVVKVLGPKDYTTGIKDNWVNTTFTYYPSADYNPDVEVTASVQQTTEYWAAIQNQHGTVLIDELPDPDTYEAPISVKVVLYGSEQDGNLVYENNEWLIDMWGEKKPVQTNTFWAYVNQNGETVEVSLDDCDYDEETETYSYTYTYTPDSTPFIFDGYATKIKSISFPKSKNFDFIPDELLLNNKILTSVVIPEGVVGIGNYAFAGSTVSTINFPSTLTDIGGDAFKEAKSLTTVDLSKTKITRLRWMTFQDATGIVTMTFPSTLIEIQKDACQRTTSLTEVDLSKCHDLRMIAQQAFEGNSGENGSALSYVKVCSHPKTIKGSEGLGAFNNCTKIKTVEVVGCHGTNLVECICENNAFAPDNTYVQTALDNIEPMGARLIFPQGPEWDMPMKSSAGNVNTEYLGYASAFDSFVGDYKVGVPFKDNQSVLEKFFKYAPRGGEYEAVNYPGPGETTTAYSASDTKMAEVYGIGNGWHEFMNVSSSIILKPTEDFLRTYSRTEGSGPVLLPENITAYRAVDYISTNSEIVKDKLNGNLYFIGDPNIPNDVANPDLYQPKEYFENLGIDVPSGKPMYKYATVEGTLYLRALRPFDTQEGAFDTDASYVPENTGVVLYADKSEISEALMLILPPYEGTQYDLTSEKYQYPHTGLLRFEKERQLAGGELGALEDNGLEIDDPENLNDNINLLQGSYGKDTPVAPVWPWKFKDKKNYTGGTYDPTDIKYREFGFSKSTNRWLRLQPGVLRYNRAYAMIPAGRFDNNNESDSQMPSFTTDDYAVGTEGSSNTFLVFGSTFEDDTVDGIQTISTSAQGYDKDAWYTLQGVRVDNPTKGVYIHNNKKVVIK